MPHVNQELITMLTHAYRSNMNLSPGVEPSLAGAILDSLEHPGSMGRALLAQSIMNAGSCDAQLSQKMAIAVEYFHTASLILDDLPCMDDAGMRRGRPCPHKRFGESSAILAALAFINRAYGLVMNALAAVEDKETRTRAARLTERLLGAAGIINGQAWDLAYRNTAGHTAQVQEIAREKTGALFRLAITLPAVISGFPPVCCQRLDFLAEAWGLAYQALDDFMDVASTPEISGKSNLRDQVKHRPNLLLSAGWEQAVIQLIAYLERSADLLQEITAIQPELGFLNDWQQQLAGRFRNFLAHAQAA